MSLPAWFQGIDFLPLQVIESVAPMHQQARALQVVSGIYNRYTLSDKVDLIAY